MQPKYQLYIESAKEQISEGANDSQMIDVAVAAVKKEIDGILKKVDMKRAEAGLSRGFSKKTNSILAHLVNKQSDDDGTNASDKVAAAVKKIYLKKYTFWGDFDIDWDPDSEDTAKWTFTAK